MILLRMMIPASCNGSPYRTQDVELTDLLKSYLSVSIGTYIESYGEVAADAARRGRAPRKRLSVSWSVSPEARADSGRGNHATHASAMEGLAAAHAQGIVHRDLKPDNLFLPKQLNDNMPIIKVLDFGISKLQADQGQADSRITRLGQVMGTPQYMALEQLESGTIDARADIYALGVICYQMLSGGLPFPTDNVAQLVTGILTRKPEPLHSVPAALNAVVSKAMAPRAHNRYQSVQELAGALRPFINVDFGGFRHGKTLRLVVEPSENKPSAKRTPMPVPPTPKPQLARWLRVGVLFVSVLVAVLVGFARWRVEDDVWVRPSDSLPPPAPADHTAAPKVTVEVDPSAPVALPEINLNIPAESDARAVTEATSLPATAFELKPAAPISNVPTQRTRPPTRSVPTQKLAAPVGRVPTQRIPPPISDMYTEQVNRAAAQLPPEPEAPVSRVEVEPVPSAPPARAQPRSPRGDPALSLDDFGLNK